MSLFPLQRSRIAQITYLLLWSFLLTLVEWGLLQASVIKFDGWKLPYSTMKYLFIFTIVCISGLVTKKLLSRISIE
ncbi:hypothetical protein [Bacillus sp. AK031]